MSLFRRFVPNLILAALVGLGCTASTSPSGSSQRETVVQTSTPQQQIGRDKEPFTPLRDKDAVTSRDKEQPKTDPRYQGRPMSSWLVDLTDADDKTRLKAEQALYAIGEEAMEPTYLVAIKPKVKPEVRHTCARIFYYGTSQGLPQLRKMLRSDDPEIAFWGAWGLASCHATKGTLPAKSEDRGLAMKSIQSGADGSDYKSYFAKEIQAHIQKHWKD